ncbi:hypothetical protein [Acidianus ambivalens]|uniref:Uncharacterized protein n=1 Tax=Acidianus ambivalens TaxID=2283 RepID=A0A650CT19_ACIAM|nr:hypothetical protein [Acidianus ambivalens]MQL55423.1 hypothetical protein [Acidianus ambivalens]QGR20959.1 hypothetical protein D1866_02145 [Acidianus ambivalens]
MSTSPVPIPISEGAVGAIAGIVGAALSYGAIRDTATCTAMQIKEKGFSYEFYPALATSTRVTKDTKNIFQVIRHGIIIRTQEGNYYYVGGKSKYWASGRAIQAYQGGAIFYNGTKGLITKMRDKESNIVVVRMMANRISSAWLQPNPPEGCNTPFVGWFLDALESAAGGAIMMNYIPYFTSRSFSDIEVPGELITVSGGHYSADTLAGLLRTDSGLPPFPYMVIATISKQATFKVPPAVQRGSAYVLFPASVMDGLCKFFLVGSFEKYCSKLVSNTSYNEALIGAPVFMSFSCTSGCKSVGLIGLVFDGNMLNVGGYSFGDLLIVEPPPYPYTDAGMLAYADELGVKDVLDLSIRGVENAEKAISSIVSVYGISAVIASAIVYYIIWTDNVDEMVNNAKPYIEKAKNVVERVREELIKTRNYRLLSYVDECVAQQDLDLDENDIYQGALDCVFSNIENVGY